MGKLLLLLGKTPFHYELSEHCFQIARAAVEEGHKVSLFLFIDGVYNLLKTQNGDIFKVKTAYEEMNELIDLGVKVSCCKLCTELRGIKNFLKSPEINATGLGQLNDELLCGCST